MRNLDFGRYALSSCVAAAILAGCGALPLSLSKGQDDMQPSIGTQGAIPQTSAMAARTPSGSEAILFSFTGTGGQLPGANPTSGLTLIEKNGEAFLYGATPAGGHDNLGSIYEVHGKSHAYLAGVLFTFDGKDGAFPYGSVSVPNANGDKILATTETGGKNDDGAVIEVFISNKKYTERVIHSFAGTDGEQPYAGLTPAAGGVYFGTTIGGGNANNGTIYELTPQGSSYKFNFIYDFPLQDAWALADPYAPICIVDLNLFGTTIDGNAKDGKGTVYEVTPKQSKFAATTATILHSFTGGNDGAYPYAGLINDAKGDLFGTTTNGGSANYGVIFELKKSGTHYSESILYSFGSGGDGEYPYGGLLLGANGVLYGTTEGGGASGLGTVYELKPSGKKYAETVLHSFAGGSQDGESPEGSLISVKGVLFGTTYGGGSSNDGTIFTLTP